VGFTKGTFPSLIENLDFSRLRNPQCRMLEEWMGHKRNYSLYKKDERRVVLKQICTADAMALARAQEGYEIIILGKKPAGNGAMAVDVEKRMYEIISGVVQDHDAAWSERVNDSVGRLMESLTKQLQQHAKRAIAEASDNYRPLAITGLGKPRKLKGVLPVEFERMCQLASQRIPIMLVGPAGCGKTYLAERVADALDMEFSDQSCSEGMSESVFNGLLLPIAANGAFKHVPSPFMERYENGGVMLLDEIDAGDPNLFTYINKAIANNSYTVAQRYTKPVVKKDADFVLIAAANTYGHGADSMYVGRNQLDAATLDRFKVGLIAMDYSQEVEKSLADDDLCNWAWQIRANIRKHKLRRIMSTRVIKDMAVMTAAYKWTVKDWNSVYFTSWPESERRMAMEGIV
jgi:AAA domain (dynein-related subfamily)